MMRRIVLLLVLTCLLVSCVPGKLFGQDATALPSGNDATAIPIPTKSDDWCKRPYADSSIWNVPIDWTIAREHPQSKEMMAAFWEGDSWIGSNPYQYAPNIYMVDNDTPLVAVKLRKNRFRDALDDQTIRYGQPGGVVMVPLPANALPAPGTDAQLVAVNVDTGEEWGIFRGAIVEGEWIADGVYRYHIDNSGIPPEGFAHRGAGVGSLAGIVRPCEVERGYIDHAVTLAYDSACEPSVCNANGWPAFIPPFTKTDGEGFSKYDIPDGARLAIRPEIALEQINQACGEVRGCVVWVLAMQMYGGFIVDNSDHPKTYAEGDETANWNPDVWTSTMLRDIPPSWYVVLDWNFPMTH